MAKTDPRPMPLEAVGVLTYTVPASRAGLIVTSVEGGTVTRSGAALQAGNTLQGGDVLTFTPSSPGGTTTLLLRQENAEFSGNYNDLDNKPTSTAGPAGRGIASVTVSGGNLTGTYTDGTAWNAGALPTSGGGGLDAEAVQDIVGTMLGTAQGTYDDAAGTYTITFPAGSGGGLTEEQVQDIVGALVRAGQNATVAYDDAAGTLTIGATGGSSSAVTSVAGRTGDVLLNKNDVGLGNVTNDAQVKRGEMGQANGVATLGADGKVPASQLPPNADPTLTTVTVTFGAAEAQNYALPAGKLYECVKASASAACNVAIYSSAADRATDNSRFVNSPTTEPTVPVRLQFIFTTADSPEAGERRGLKGTLYLKSSAACTLTLTLKEI